MAYEIEERIALADMPELDKGDDTTPSLKLRTAKTSRGLASTCNVEFCGNGFYRFEMFGDYRETRTVTAARATEKAVKAQHAAAFTPMAIEEIKAKIRAFYAAKLAKAA